MVKCPGNHAQTGTNYICTDCITDEERRIFTKREKGWNSIRVKHQHCSGCKTRFSYQYTLLQQIQSNGHEIYFPLLNCNDLIKWQPESK